MALPENKSSRSSNSKIQAFILEPILTPSGLLDGGDDGVDLALFNPDSPEDVNPLAEIYQDFSNEELEPISFFEEIEADQITEIASTSVPSFDSGIFTVGDTGKVTVDFLFDGGGYEGELAIFSLEGLNPESEDFGSEAANRALSNSELGYIVISDATDRARFSGELGEADHNSGIYKQGDPVSMKPGDRFGFMLIPNGTVEEFLDNPDKGNLRPLFSVATANPEDAFHLGQIADVTGDGSTFVMEDLRVDGKSDLDYNDIIFQVRGATGEAELLDNVIEDGQEWRDTELGEAILEYANPQVDPPVTDYNFPTEDQPLIGFIDTGFSGDNPDLDYEKISLGTDKIANDADPLLAPGEGNEHGTHVLGIVAAENNNDIGIDGINDDAPIWLGRAVNSGKWAESLMEFVDAAKESGQPNAIANLSFDLTQIDIDGVETTRYEFTPPEMAALEYAQQNNVLVAVAAGNEGEVMSALGQASQQFDNIITVGSAEQMSGETSVWQGFDRAEYSNHGEGLDIVANGGHLETPVTSTVGNGVGTMVGTSVATAKVTGAASQVWAANPNLNYRQVIEILKSTAADISELGEDVETGAELLNIAAAVSLARTVESEAYNPKLQKTPPTPSDNEQITPWERAVFQNFPVPNTNTLAGKKIILDPGHGITDIGFDPGASGN
ncbi:MAG: S8 family serine peptidase, partial [Spirulinaceae cyanobacterium]